MKTAELTGRLLDYWVAKAEGLDPVMRGPAMPMVLATDAQRVVAQSKWVTVKCYSDDWNYGGPIIERERIAVVRFEHEWCAYLSSPGEADAGGWYGDFSIDVSDIDANGVGETPLIAAMRAYVASKHGDEMPDEVPA